MNRIRELRKNRGLTLKEVAKAVMIAPSQLSFYETGKRQPRELQTWENLANYFGVSVGYIMGVSDYNGVDEYWEEVAKTNILEADILNAVDTIGEKRLTDVYLFFEKELRKEYLKTIPDNKKYQIDEYIKIGLENIKTMLWELPDNIVQLLLYWSLLDENDRTHLFEIVKSLSNKTIDN
ncbi:helix-turn-helix domain-containing protein [Enterococcus cecorum]|uniref:helix-turn-helix domain-containing protein n=1 Tax=Enterococcus cecorum TaxID=44008 RepID=UPI00148E7392|nr:helix-turn-helix transcriptional regulator [Enterococcus cecorum]